MFLNECCKVGLDSAIVSPSKILPLSKINNKHLKICNQLINDDRRYDNSNCIYDPLTELTKAFDGISTNEARSNKDSFQKLPIEKRLKQHIIDGEKVGLKENIESALKKYPNSNKV